MRNELPERKPKVADVDPDEAAAYSLFLVIVAATFGVLCFMMAASRGLLEPGAPPVDWFALVRGILL